MFDELEAYIEDLKFDIESLKGRPGMIDPTEEYIATQQERRITLEEVVDKLEQILGKEPRY